MNIAYTSNMEHLVTLTAIKNSTYVLVFAVTMEYLGFNPHSMGILIALMTVDVITGIVRACVQEGCHTVRSSIGVRGVLAKILLLTALFSVGIAGKGVGFEMNSIVQGAVNILIIAELYSILGNIHSARTGKKKNEFDAVAFILKQIKNLLTKYLSHP